MEFKEANIAGGINVVVVYIKLIDIMIIYKFQFQKNFIQPLLMGLLGCYQQVEILTECIRKKDAELNQYRIEQGVLSRSKLKRSLKFMLKNF